MKEKMVRVGYGIMLDTTRGFVLQEAGFAKTKAGIERWRQDYGLGLSYKIVEFYADKTILSKREK